MIFLFLLVFLTLTACTANPPSPVEETNVSASTTTPARALNDRELSEAVQNAIGQDPLLRDSRVNVVAQGSRISLEGHVQNAQAFLRIQTIVRQVNGVSPPVNVEKLSYNP